MSWADHARCRDADPNLFFGEGGGTAQHAIHVYCNHCPVRIECLNDALATETAGRLRYGVRGGMTPQERARHVKYQRQRDRDRIGRAITKIRADLQETTR